MPALYVMRTDGTDRRRITNVAQDIGRHAWAPDGKGLYISFVRDGAQRLAYVTLDGHIREIADGLLSEGGFDIEPSMFGGAELSVGPQGIAAVIASPAEPGQVYNIDPSGKPRRLTDLHAKGVAQ